MRSLLAALALVVAGEAWAQAYPARPLRFVVPFPPGGGMDIVARAVGEKLSPRLAQAAGIDLTHVPYKGTTQILPDILDARVDLALDSLPAYLPHIQSGKLRVFAVASRSRSSLLPELPTMAEAGVPGVVSATDYALFAPAGTRRDIVLRLYRETAAVLEAADVRAKFATQGIEVRGGTPEALQAELADELAKWGRVIQAANIRAE